MTKSPQKIHEKQENNACIEVAFKNELLMVKIGGSEIFFEKEFSDEISDQLQKWFYVLDNAIGLISFGFLISLHGEDNWKINIAAFLFVGLAILTSKNNFPPLISKLRHTISEYEAGKKFTTEQSKDLLKKLYKLFLKDLGVKSIVRVPLFWVGYLCLGIKALLLFLPVLEEWAHSFF